MHQRANCRLQDSKFHAETTLSSNYQNHQHHCRCRRNKILLRVIKTRCKIHFLRTTLICSHHNDKILLFALLCYRCRRILIIFISCCIASFVVTLSIFLHSVIHICYFISYFWVFLLSMVLLWMSILKVWLSVFNCSYFLMSTEIFHSRTHLFYDGGKLPEGIGLLYFCAS